MIPSNQNLYLTICVRHSITTQKELDLSIENLKKTGFKPTLIRSLDDIKILKEKFAKKPDLLNTIPYIFADKEFEDIDNLTDSDYETIVDDCLNCFGENSSVRLMNKEDRINIISKGKPTLKCGLAIDSQNGISFNIIRNILENSGFKNVRLNEENHMWMKVDFETPILWIHSFQERYLKGLEINDCEIFSNRYSREYYKKELYKITYSIVPIKHRTYFDFSGDDLSLDPRLW